MINALSALLVFAFVIYFFRMLAGDGGERKARMEERVRKAKERAEAVRARRASVSAEDMTQCTVCDAYIPKSNLRNCGRSDCPYEGVN